MGANRAHRPGDGPTPGTTRRLGRRLPPFARPKLPLQSSTPRCTTQQRQTSYDASQRPLHDELMMALNPLVHAHICRASGTDGTSPHFPLWRRQSPQGKIRGAGLAAHRALCDPSRAKGFSTTTHRRGRDSAAQLPLAAGPLLSASPYRFFTPQNQTRSTLHTASPHTAVPTIHRPRKRKPEISVQLYDRLAYTQSCTLPLALVRLLSGSILILQLYY